MKVNFLVFLILFYVAFPGRAEAPGKLDRTGRPAISQPLPSISSKAEPDNWVEWGPEDDDEDEVLSPAPKKPKPPAPKKHSSSWYYGPWDKPANASVVSGSESSSMTVTVKHGQTFYLYITRTSKREDWVASYDNNLCRVKQNGLQRHPSGWFPSERNRNFNLVKIRATHSKDFTVVLKESYKHKLTGVEITVHVRCH